MRIRRIVHPDERVARTLLTLTKRTDGSGLLERNEIELTYRNRSAIQVASDG